MIEEESTENTTTFDLGDGKSMTVFYGRQVRYENEQGELADCDPSLVEKHSSTILTQEGSSRKTPITEKQTSQTHGIYMHTVLMIQ